MLEGGLCFWGHTSGVQIFQEGTDIEATVSSSRSIEIDQQRPVSFDQNLIQVQISME